MSLHKKSVLSDLLRNLLKMWAIHIVSVHSEFKSADVNMVKVVNKHLSNFALKFVIFN